MEGKRCPYCGRRISYFTTFHEKKKGLHTCERCGKESKIKTDLRLMFAFAAVVLLIILFMILWNNSGNYNNVLGILICIAALIVFYFLTPLFIRFVPLKKYSKINETGGAGGDDFENENYLFDRDAFNKIKKNRSNAQLNSEKTMIREVPIIEDVSEAHASSSDKPLRRVHNQPEPEYEPEVEFREDVKTYVPKKKPDGSRYTANRKL